MFDNCLCSSLCVCWRSALIVQTLQQLEIYTRLFIFSNSQITSSQSYGTRMWLRIWVRTFSSMLSSALQNSLGRYGPDWMRAPQLHRQSPEILRYVWFHLLLFMPCPCEGFTAYCADQHHRNCIDSCDFPHYANE